MIADFTMTLDRRYKLYQAIRQAALGLFGAVITLFCLHKGMNLYQVGLFFGLYYIAVICFDLPAGVLADRFGRLRLFYWAKLFDVVYFIVLIVADDVVILILASSLGGIARSLSNGVLESWYYEQLKVQDRLDELAQLLSAAQAWIKTGVALGALIGAGSVQFLGYWLTPDNPFLPVLYTAIGFHLTLFLTLGVFFHEGENLHNRPKCKLTGLGVIRKTFVHCWGHPVLRTILLLQILHGVLVSSLQSYWQPVLQGFLEVSSNVFAIGLVSTGYFLSVALASKLLARLLSHTAYDSDWLIFPLFALASTLLLLLSFVESVGAFVCLYLAFGFFMLAVNPLMSTIMHHHTDDQYRATNMSLLNFAFNFGGLMVGMIFSQIAQIYSIQLLWLLMGAMGLLLSLWFRSRWS